MVRILGPIEILVDGSPLDLGRPQTRLVLAHLIAYVHEPISRDRLIESLWPDVDPRTAGHRLNVQIAALRKTLAGAPGIDLQTVGRGYRLNLPADSVDAEAFTQLVESATALDDPSERARRLEEAEQLWRGEPFGEFSRQPELSPIADRLADQRRTAQIVRIEAKLSMGALSTLTTELSELIEDDPFREQLWDLLIRALYAEGRQADALAAYRRLREGLAEELGIDPSPRLQALEEQVLVQDPTLAVAAALPRRRSSLPAERTQLIGRSIDLAEVEDRLATGRLVTLVGAGGAGKTRLAIRIAHRYLERSTDGAAFVDLSAAIDRDGLGSHLLAALRLSNVAGHSAISSVVQAVGDRDMLIVVDNCEHLIDAVAAAVDKLVETSTRLRLLITSREPLGLAGEKLWRVNPLPTPSPSAGFDEMASSDSVRLFIERASDAAPDLEPESHLATIAEICRRLDGLPLAIELAAARMSTMSPTEVADGLAERFRLLNRGTRTSSPRHRTLTATIDWSDRLLTTDHRLLLDRLSVFVGPFGAHAVEEVCGWSPFGTQTVTEALQELVLKSLVVAEPDADTTSYRLLESIREYAWLRLVDSDQLDPVVDRYLSHYVSAAASMERNGLTDRWREAMDWVDREADNVADVWNRLHDSGDVVRSLALSASLARLFTTAGRNRQVAEWVGSGLATAGTEGVPPGLGAKAMLFLAMAGAGESSEQAEAYGRRAYAHYLKAGNHAGAAWAGYALAGGRSLLGDLDGAIEWSARSVMHAEQSDVDLVRAWTLPKAGVYRAVPLLDAKSPDESETCRAMIEQGDVLAEAIGNCELSALARLASANVSICLDEEVDVDLSDLDWLDDYPSPMTFDWHATIATLALLRGDADVARTSLESALITTRLAGLTAMNRKNIGEMTLALSVIEERWEAAASLAAHLDPVPRPTFAWGRVFDPRPWHRRLAEAVIEESAAAVGSPGHLSILEIVETVLT